MSWYRQIMGIPQYAMSNVFIRPVKHSLCYSIKEQICHLPAGCRSLWKICMSMGKCNLLRTISTLLPVNLLALLILLVCQSVQYNSSSNKVRANGWGSPRTETSCVNRITTTQHKTTQHNTIQHNTTQYNTTQYKLCFGKVPHIVMFHPTVS